MAVLARDSPFKAQLALGTWLQPLLFFAADAAAGDDMTFAARALDSFSAAVHAGGARLAADLAACNVLPLVALLWRSSDDKLRSFGDELRRSLMTAVAASVRAGRAATFFGSFSSSGSVTFPGTTYFPGKDEVKGRGNGKGRGKGTTTCTSTGSNADAGKGTGTGKSTCK